VSRLFKEVDTRAQDSPLPAPKNNAMVLMRGILLVAFTLLCVYITFRGASLFHAGYSIVDRIFAVLLLSAELFVMLHSTGYLATLFRANKAYDITRSNLLTPTVAPMVAVLIASFNENPEMLEDTIAAVNNMDYVNKHVFLVDDSTDEKLKRETEALTVKYGCTFVHRANRRGFKAGAINDLLKDLREKYVAIFDADQKPVHNFLKETVPLLEADEALAFVQTPQFYANTQHSAVARGASYQQAVFYEFICEGKSTVNAMFCCGTNVVMCARALNKPSISTTNSYEPLNQSCKEYEEWNYNQEISHSTGGEAVFEGLFQFSVSFMFLFSYPKTYRLKWQAPQYLQ